MRKGRPHFHKGFASASLGFLLLSVSALPRAIASTSNTPAKREMANAQFTRAEEMRAALNEKPIEKRTLAEYKKVVITYQRVYLITPHAPEVPDSLVAVAELNIEMGDHFGRSYYQAAADAYQFLIHEYPTSKYVGDSMIHLGQLQKDQLGDLAAAAKSYQDYLKKFPHSPRKREVQEALAELSLMKNAEAGTMDAKSAKPPAAKATVPASKPAEIADEVSGNSNTDGGEEAKSGVTPHVQKIRSSVTPEGTEIIVELEDSVQYVSGRIANPDRIYFDLQAARLSPALVRNKIKVTGDMVPQVRVAQNAGGIVRIVLEINGVKDYAATLLSKPSRLVIELYGDSSTHGPVQVARAVAPATRIPAKSDGASDAKPIAADSSVADSNGGVSDSEGVVVAASQPASAKPMPSAKVTTTHSTRMAVPTKPELIQPATAPVPTRDGSSTLTRTLGLKISRIVIDAGHGGHDTGTIGPTGLMEKDLCLDVALRLGKIIQQKLPAADIVYTRSDDTFIPLEERTRIANEAKADLFISIHANSSPDHGARGIETYYLNLKGSPDAMEVAARENATAQEGIHDLEDIVKKIARTEKIDESREFAADVQDSLSKRIQKTAKPVKNRGVRKAPFVVLIGADMPSILTEISFLSNPSDEQLLKKPDHRQHVAEGIYSGVSEYLQSLNSMAVNTKGSKTGRVVPTSSVESRNQE
jgi:N-acetylmuramoyl-L-alanine amidase